MQFIEYKKERSLGIEIDLPKSFHEISKNQNNAKTSKLETAHKKLIERKTLISNTLLFISKVSHLLQQCDFGKMQGGKKIGKFCS